MSKSGARNDHPFAQWIRILGVGPGRSRSLTESEAYDAMRMIRAGEVEPVQLGALLMLMRYKRETAEELAGFARALQADPLETAKPALSSSSVSVSPSTYSAEKVNRWGIRRSGSPTTSTSGTAAAIPDRSFSTSACWRAPTAVRSFRHTSSAAAAAAIAGTSGVPGQRPA